MAFRLTAISLIALATLTLSQVSCAYPVPEAPEPVLLNNADGQYNHWNGIGLMFREGRRWCTASLMDTRDANNVATGPAYILTNAHCALIVSGTSTSAPFKGQIQFNFFQDTQENAKRYDIEKVNWASLANADVAIMELNASLETLLKDGITPLKLASKAPAKPGPINVVGAPAVAPFIRLSTCTQEPTKTTLIKYMTVHTDYQKHDCKGIAPGSSGSPVIDPKTGEMVGVLSGTTYGISDDDVCFWHALCGNEKKKSILPNQASHSFPVDYLAQCFSSGRFTIDHPRCTLSPNFNFKSERNADIALHKAPIMPTDKAPTWDVEFSMSTAFYRFKTVQDAQACFAADHYSGPISTANAKIEAPIGRKPGLYYLCLIGVDSAEQRPSAGLRRNTQILTARLVEPGTTTLRGMEITQVVFDGYMSVKYRKREEYSRNIWTQQYTLRAGETTCPDTQYKGYESVDSGFMFRLDHLPVTVCLYNMDRNFNTSAITQYVVENP